MSHLFPTKLAQSLQGARITLQRTRDAQFVHGWVRSVDQEQLLVRLPARVAIHTGDQFAARVYRAGDDLVFEARMSAVEQEESDGSLIVGFRTEGQMAVAPHSGDARFARIGQAEMNRKAATLCDVSHQGVALLSSERPNVGARVSLWVEGISLEAEVRYARPMRGSDQFRVGLRLDVTDRVTRARWMEFVRGEAEGDGPPSSRLAA